MRKKILGLVALILVGLAGYVISIILDLLGSGLFFEPYERAGIRAVVILLVIVSLFILCLYFLFKKNQEKPKFGQVFANHPHNNFKQDSIYIEKNSFGKKNIFREDSLPLQKGRIKSIKLLQFASLFFAPFYISIFLFLFFRIDSKDNYEFIGLYVLALFIILSLIIPIGLFLRLRWAWGVSLFFAFLQLLWFPWGTLAGIFLCLFLLVSAPEPRRISMNEDAYQNKSKSSKAPLSKNYISRSLSK